ncbi:luciferase family oxidoreductase, group 1 [compost metagenome]
MQSIPPSLRESLERELAFMAIGTQEDVRLTLQQFIDFTGADELMIDARIYDPAARRKSYQIAAQSLADLLN